MQLLSGISQNRQGNFHSLSVRTEPIQALMQALTTRRNHFQAEVSKVNPAQNLTKILYTVLEQGFTLLNRKI
jgi:hypothetical protein